MWKGMRRKSLLFIFVIAAISFFAALFPESVYAETITGECGPLNEREKVTWTLTDDGVLTIQGKGPMDDRDVGPWYEEECKLIKKVIINEGVTSAGMFAYCENLIEVSLPESVTRIEFHAFQDCKSLKKINIPPRVTVIDMCAFQGCTSLTHIEIPDSVRTIWSYAFEGCINLKSIKLPKNVRFWSQEVFLGDRNLTEITLPNLKRVVYRLFDGCSSLTDITIPKTVTKMDEEVFINCTSLKTIKFEGDIPTMEKNCFNNVSIIAYYPDYWKTVPGRKEFGGNVTWIPYNTATGKKGESPDPPRIKIESATDEVAAGNGIQINLPEGYNKRKAQWIVSNPKIARITKSGKLIFKKNAAGKTVTVTVRYKDPKGRLRTVSRTYKCKVRTKKLSIKGKNTIKAGRSRTYKVSVNKGASSKVIWRSGNKKYATVSKGKVKAKKAGKGKIVVIHVKAQDGTKKTASIKIFIQ